MSSPITFQAVFNTARKTKDGGWMITLELGSHDVDTVAQLSRHDSEVLNVAIIPDSALSNESSNDVI